MLFKLEFLRYKKIYKFCVKSKINNLARSYIFSENLFLFSFYLKLEKEREKIKKDNLLFSTLYYITYSS